MGGSSNTKIARLKGESNWEAWKVDIAAVLSSEKVWGYTADKPRFSQPKAPKPPEGRKAYKDANENDQPAVPPTNGEQREFRQGYKEYQKDLGEWEDGYETACSHILLNLVDDLKTHIAGLTNSTEAMRVLYSLFDHTDAQTVDSHIRQITRKDQEEFESLLDYGNHMKSHQKKLTDMGKPLPEWVLASCFRAGINPELHVYIAGMQSLAKRDNTTLTLQDMLNELLEYDNRSKDSKALALRKSKGSRNHSANPGKGKGNSGQSSDDKGKCEGCGGLHKTANCYFLYEDKRPEGWEAFESKQHLLAENRTDAYAKKPTAVKKVKKVLITCRLKALLSGYEEYGE